ncbi:MAG TPA: DUF1634 domain-containing protein [Thermomicrobiales bacterium]|jgi:hypothetical protein|nr:DUF1634 domain-containing protein [Thermomicrobiales bacterium]
MKQPSSTPSPAETQPADVVYRIARLCLVSGFFVCVAFVVASLVASVVSGDPIGRETFTLGELPDAVADGNPAAFAELAIFAIVLTPVVTTLGIIAGFLRLGDRRFAAISTLVLIVLAGSMIVSLLR